MAPRYVGRGGECFEGRAGHNPGCIVRPALGSWSCSACVRDAPGTPGTFHIAAHQSTPGPWCRGGVGLLGREEFPGAVVVFVVAVAHEPDKSGKACLAVLVSGALVCAVELR